MSLTRFQCILYDSTVPFCSPLQYFNFKSLKGPNSTSLIRFQYLYSNFILQCLYFTTKHQYTSMNLYHLTLEDYFMKSGKNERPLTIRKSLQIIELSKLRQTMTLNGKRLEIMETQKLLNDAYWQYYSITFTQYCRVKGFQHYVIS